MERRGDVSGRAEVSATRAPQCTPWGFAGDAKGPHVMRITGTFDGSTFQLSFHSPIPADGFDVALYTLYRPEPQTIVAPLSGRTAGVAFVFTDVDAATEYVATLDGYLFLRCEECSIGG